MSNPTALSHLAGRVTSLEGSLTSVFSFKGNVPLVGDLPSVGNSAGDAYIVQDDDSFQVWSGTAWVSGGSIRGTDGTNGENGAAGKDGLDGAAGADGAVGADGAEGNGIATAVYSSETGDLVITMTNASTYTFNIKGSAGADGADGADGVVDYVVRVSGNSLVADAIDDAYGDCIGVLVEVASNTNLELPANSGGTTRVDGKMLRFFCNAPSNDAHHYSVKENGGAEIFQIHGQEAYTMIWREASTDWLVVPGIINPKSKPLPT